MLGSKLKIKMSSWLANRGPESDIVISSRVRLARNIDNHSFPSWADEEELREVRDLIREAMDGHPFLKKFTFLPLEELSDSEKEILVEEHLISPQFSEADEGYAVALSRDGKVSIMINEEDHLRIQCLFPGLQLREAWQGANEIDDHLGQNLQFAFSEQLGFLTVCPTNVGTAMRASVMMHLPGLFLSKKTDKLFKILSEQGMAIRGLFGEGTHGVGNLYQISNQTTLGRSEEEIVTNLDNVCRDIAEKERRARKDLLKADKIKIVDKVERALAILNRAKIISFHEGIELLSTLRFGANLNLTPKIDETSLSQLMVLIRPAHLQNVAKKELGAEAQDVFRANLMREKLEL